MARTLPWLSNGAAPTAKTRTTKPTQSSTKRQRILDPDSDDESPLTPAPTPRRTAISNPQRTPSTSPPPAPPTEEAMRPGLSADDIYIMVEDEFLSAAHTFTQHLHHAEYTRLKSLAHTHHTSTISTISRPTDSITAMRAETKKRKEAQAREAKTKAAVDKLKSKGRPRSESDSEHEEWAEEDKLNAPWSGTVLQSFMTTSPSQTGAPSLTGLQGVKSSTRAAAGYSKPVAPQTAKLFDLSPKPKTQKRPPPRASSSTADSDDDDLDALPAPKKRHSPPPARKLPETPMRKAAEALFRRATADPAPPPPLPQILKKSSTSTMPSSSRLPPPPPPAENPIPKIAKRASFDLDATGPPCRNQGMSEAARRRLKARRERERQGDGGGGGVDEIPIFLV